MLALITGALLAAIAACGGGDDATPTSSAPTATSPAPTATSTPGEVPIPPTPTATTPPIPAWQLDWDQTLAAAKEEGVVIVGVTRAGYRTGLEQVMEVFPDIVIEAQVGRGAETRFVTEYDAGIFSVDVGFGGNSTAHAVLLPAGILGDTRAQMIRPDVIDDENWIGVFDDYWCDDLHGRKHIFCHWATRSGAAAFINTELADPATFTFDDLFKPENRGRWCLLDPRSSGAGEGFITEVMLNKGTAYLRALLETEPFIGADDRTMAQDIIRGEFIFCSGVAPVADFHREGVGLHVQLFASGLSGINPEFEGVKSICCGSGRGKTEIEGLLNSGIGGPYLYLEPPNPNAAKILLNWIGTKEGAETYLLGTVQTASNCSGRVDVQHLCPFEALEDGGAYIDFNRGTALPFRDTASDIAKEVLGGR